MNTQGIDLNYEFSPCEKKCLQTCPQFLIFSLCSLMSAVHIGMYELFDSKLSKVVIFSTFIAAVRTHGLVQ